GATVGLLVAFAVMYPNQPIFLAFLFPIPAKYFVLIYGVLEFLSASRYVHDGVAHVTHIAGMVIGFLYLRSDWRPRRLLAGWQRRVRSRHLRVVRFEDERHRPMSRADQEEIDAILDKISREGIDSLTEAEVRKLRERSSR
ncbi:MAG: rhomboid family intramembrane serine protease, partial [Candidatus Eiseniibacteriota bacterium]